MIYKTKIDIGTITFSDTIKNVTLSHKRLCLKLIRRLQADFFKDKGISCNIRLNSYHNDEYPNFNYNIELPLEKCWPYGSAGNVWLGEIPEKDSI